MTTLEKENKVISEIYRSFNINQICSCHNKKTTLLKRGFLGTIKFPFQKGTISFPNGKFMGIATYSLGISPFDNGGGEPFEVSSSLGRKELYSGRSYSLDYREELNCSLLIYK